MGLSRDNSIRCGLLAVSLALSGCLPNALPTTVTPASTPLNISTPTPAEGIITRQDFSKLLIEGTMYGMADMSGDAVIKADSPDIGNIDTSDPGDVDLEGLDIPGFRVLANGPRKPIENAAITLKGYDWKVIPLMPTKPSNPEGKFKFRQVPAKVAFFMDASYAFGGKTYRQFGLVRTKDVTEVTTVEIDAASTLVSRFLLRLMQRAATPKLINKPIDFQDLSPKDYNPLLTDLRDLLAGGLPSGMDLDLTKVAQPDGAWTAEMDAADSAVVLLDKLAAYPQIKFDMQRLVQAIAKTHQIDYTKLRPDSLK